MAFCTNCGQQIPDGTSFCTNCGAPLKQDGAPQMQPYGQQPQEQTARPRTETQGQAARPWTETQGQAYGQSQAQQPHDSASAMHNETMDSSFSSAGPAQAAGADREIPEALPRMGFVESVKTCFSKYVTFSGRARRSELWFFVLFMYLVTLIISNLSSILSISAQTSNIISSVVSLIFFLPHLAAEFRRLHDVGKSGWWLLFLLLPVIGWAILIYQLCKDSEPFENEYGESPKYPGRTL